MNHKALIINAFLYHEVDNSVCYWCNTTNNCYTNNRYTNNRYTNNRYTNNRYTNNQSPKPIR